MTPAVQMAEALLTGSTFMFQLIDLDHWWGPCQRVSWGNEPDDPPDGAHHTCQLVIAGWD